MNKHALRFLLPAAALAATLVPAFAQNNLPSTEILRQKAVIEAHRYDLESVGMVLGVVDAAVVCTTKDAKWGLAHRSIVLRQFDQLTHEMGLSDGAIYALRQDMESVAHKVTVEAQCEKFTETVIDEFTARLDRLH